MIWTGLVSQTDRCAACGAGGLLPHLRVAGEAGEQGLTPTTDRFGTALSDIVRCPACGHMQIAPMPDREELGEAYADAASDEYLDEERGQRRTANLILDRIERYATRGALLDLGCWVGFLLDEARARGWETVGVEPSEFASRYARERLGLDVRTAELLEAELPERRFDAAFMGDVIEHLPDPGAALRRIAGLLTEDGVLCLALPDAGSRLARLMGRRWWSVIPTHVQYFTRSSLRTLLERHGYRILWTGTAPKSFTVRYYLKRTGGYAPSLARALVGGASGVRLADRLWTPDFRDRMGVIARGPAHY
jgi:SAM-dependent methyltransferase